MKKSEIYKFAQIAILHEQDMSAGAKLEVLEELMDAEKLALWREKQEEKNV